MRILTHHIYNFIVIKNNNKGLIFSPKAYVYYNFIKDQNYGKSGKVIESLYWLCAVGFP